MPDLKPIDNLWSIRKSREQKFDCTSTTMLIDDTLLKYGIETVTQRKLPKTGRIHAKASN